MKNKESFADWSTRNYRKVLIVLLLLFLISYSLDTCNTSRKMQKYENNQETLKKILKVKQDSIQKLLKNKGYENKKTN